MSTTNEGSRPVPEPTVAASSSTPPRFQTRIGTDDTAARRTGRRGRDARDHVGDSMLGADRLIETPLAGRARPRLELLQPIKGFVVEPDDGVEPTLQLVCREVRGFRDAMMAAHDPRAPMPSRLVLVLPDADMGKWLAAWSEDCERIRRTLTVRRLFDDRTITAVATLASYGCSIDTSLGIESIAIAGAVGPAFRSGVHGRGFGT